MTVEEFEDELDRLDGQVPFDPLHSSYGDYETVEDVLIAMLDHLVCMDDESKMLSLKISKAHRFLRRIAKERGLHHRKL